MVVFIKRAIIIMLGTLLILEVMILAANFIPAKDVVIATIVGLSIGIQLSAIATYKKKHKK